MSTILIRYKNKFPENSGNLYKFNINEQFIF